MVMPTIRHEANIQDKGQSVHVVFNYLPALKCGVGGAESVVGKHPDLMVAHPTSTIFPTIGRNF
jgi:hypothetical protein